MVEDEPALVRPRPGIRVQNRNVLRRNNRNVLGKTVLIVFKVSFFLLIKSTYE